MDHALVSYLGRLPSATLEKLLQEIYSGGISGNYMYIVPIIEKILEQRRRTLG